MSQWSPNFPQRELTRGLQAVPTSLTVIPGATDDTYLFQLVVSNPTAASINLTVQDTTSGNKIFNALPIDVGIPTILVASYGILCKGGIKWIASDTGLLAEVVGVARG